MQHSGPSDYGVSVDIGQLKEELDASRGGSGFSFADLGADRAGAVFAQEIAGSFIGSKRFLSRSHDLGADDIVPILADLPENIELVDLDAKYGGTNGVGYTTLVEEIDSRIQSLHRGGAPLK